MSRVIADVIIVGGGVMGCSAAFHLARRRGPRVIVVEKGSLASGMTKRSGALIHTHYARAAEARLALASLRYFQNWKDIAGGSCEFTPTGLAVVARETTDADALRENVEMRRGIGVNTQVLSPAALRELQPAARVDDIALAAYEPEAGYADPVAATQAFAARAKELGAAFRTGTFVKNIRVDGSRVIGVETNIGQIDALAVVVAAGPWSDRLLKPLGVEIGIRPARAQVAFFDRPLELKAGHAAFIDLTTGAHFRPHTFGLTMGGLNAPQETPTNPDHFDEAIAPEYVSDLRQRIAARVPALGRARFVRGHAGVYDMSPDGRAVLGRAPGLAGLIIAAGFSGTGFALAPAAGACIAEMIADGAASTVGVSALKWRQFRDKESG